MRSNQLSYRAIQRSGVLVSRLRVQKYDKFSKHQRFSQLFLKKKFPFRHFGAETRGARDSIGQFARRLRHRAATSRRFDFAKPGIENSKGGIENSKGGIEQPKPASGRADAETRKTFTSPLLPII